MGGGVSIAFCLLESLGLWLGTPHSYATPKPIARKREAQIHPYPRTELQKQVGGHDVHPHLYLFVVGVIK